MSKKKAGCNVLPDVEAVRGVLKDIGRDRISNGDATHDIFNRMLYYVPLYYANKFFIDLGNSVLKKQRARAPQVVEKKIN